MRLCECYGEKTNTQTHAHTNAGQPSQEQSEEWVLSGEEETGEGSDNDRLGEGEEVNRNDRKIRDT